MALNQHRNALATTLNSLSSVPELQFSVLVKSSPKGLDCTYANKLHAFHLLDPHKELPILRKLVEQTTSMIEALEREVNESA
jgi:hypothetical protein